MKRLIDADVLMLKIENSMKNNPHKDERIALNHNTEHLHFKNLVMRQEMIHEGNPYCAEREVEGIAYYEALIQGEIPARTAYEMMIQEWTKTDAGLVLAAIGLEHPASVLVHRYLANQKYEKINPRAGIIRGMIDTHRNPHVRNK